MFDKNFNNPEDSGKKIDIITTFVVMCIGLFGNILMLGLFLFLLKTLGILIPLILFVIGLIVLVTLKYFEIKDLEENKDEIKTKLEENTDTLINFNNIPNTVNSDELNKKVLTIHCQKCNDDIDMFERDNFGKTCQCGTTYLIICFDDKTLIDISSRNQNFQTSFILKKCEEE